MNLKTTLETLDKLDVDALAIGLCEDTLPQSDLLNMLDWRLCGALSKLIKEGALTGQSDESVLMSSQGRIGPKRIFFFGWGEHKLAATSCQTNLHRMLAVLKRAGVHSCALSVPEQCDEASKAATGLLRKELPVQVVGIF